MADHCEFYLLHPFMKWILSYIKLFNLLLIVLNDIPTRILFEFSMLADKLNMSPEDAERWIVNLIRNARLDAKIDSKLVSILIASICI